MLERAGIPFRLVAPGPERGGEAGAPAVRALARARSKAAGAPVGLATGLLLAADTVVAAGGDCLGKPRDRDDAERMLRRLLGREHEVWTAHVVCPVEDGRRLAGVGDHEIARAVVAMRDLGEDELAAYLGSGDWEGKAGGYGIQGLADRFADVVAGERDTVVGMTMSWVRQAWAAYAGD